MNPWTLPLSSGQKEPLRTGRPGAAAGFGQPTLASLVVASPQGPAIGAGRALPLRVLLAEHCPVQQLRVCALLSQWRILPQIVADGLAAVLTASEQDFDIILMDLEMPVLDGLAATGRIRRNERRSRRVREVPIVAYAATPSPEDEQRWRALGIDAVLSKSADARALAQCLARCCPGDVAVSQTPLGAQVPPLGQDVVHAA